MILFILFCILGLYELLFTAINGIWLIQTKERIMGQKKRLLHISMPFSNLLLIIVSVLFLSSTHTFSQERYTFRLKDGTELFGYNPFLDTLKSRIVMETPEGEVIRFPYESVYSDNLGPFINIYEHTRKAPYRLKEIPFGIDTCRLTDFYFFELRGVGMYADSIYIGIESAIGLRLGMFNFGFGAGLWNISDIPRIPVFVHIKVDLLDECIRPFVYTDFGIIYDEYKIMPSIKHLMEPGPKFAGIGLGFDIPVSKTMDFSLDGGVRYVVVANERQAPSCDPLIYSITYTEYYMGYIRIGVTF